jgi:hypothetical protein
LPSSGSQPDHGFTKIRDYVGLGLAGRPLVDGVLIVNLSLVVWFALDGLLLLVIGGALIWLAIQAVG